MNGELVGVLPPDQTLHRFLAQDVLRDILGLDGGQHVFEIYDLGKSLTICRYFDRHTTANIVGKSYGKRWLRDTPTAEPDLRELLMRREFDRIQQVRALGLSEAPIRAVRPFVASVEQACTIFEEFVPGDDLTSYISRAVAQDSPEQMLNCLSRLAEFFGELHTRSLTFELVDDTPALDYLLKVINQLAGWHIIAKGQQETLQKTCHLWAESGVLRSSNQVLVHGDANSANFLWDSEHNLTVIDFERAAPGDRAADLGAVAAELKHLFWLYSQDEWRSEQFIKHFFNRYQSAFIPNHPEDMPTLADRCRFYMGCVELRIGRNHWIDLDHRLHLINDAFKCLRI
jgi:aminoglycoside phosphotransferase (APT) family kinase protein